MELQNLTGEMLTDRIRSNAQKKLLILIPAAVIVLLTGIVLTLKLRAAGAVIGALLLAAVLYPLISLLPRWLHPEQADVFCKYGTPDSVAEQLRKGCGNVFFDNGRMVLTELYVLDAQKPEMLLFFPHALTVYPDAVQGKESYVAVYDEWGQKLRYPFTNGRQQVIKIDAVTDKIRRHNPKCRGGHRPEDLEYVRKNRIELPEHPQQDDAGT